MNGREPAHSLCGGAATACARADLSREGGQLLRIIAEGTAGATGTEFFRSLVRSLATALDTSCAFVTEFTDANTLVHPLAFWSGDQYLDADAYPIAGSPCESVLNGEIAAFPNDVSARFPVEREALDSLGAQSYLAIPIKNAAGAVLGHLAAIDQRPRDWSEVDFGILRIFGARAAGELERRWYEREVETANAALRREVEQRSAGAEALRQSEQAWRELYEEAPVAYLTLGTDAIVQRVNARVTEVLGYTRAALVGHRLAEFGAGPAAAAALQEIFARCLRGDASADREIEFRTAAGRSVWAALSLTPVRDREDAIVAARTVVVDITERKAAERELEHRLTLENLVATASSRFVRADPQEVDAEIDRCMMEMANFFRIERMCVYRFASDEHAAMHTHAWIAPGITPPPDEILCSDLPALFRDVLHGRVIGAKSLDELPGDYAPLRKRLQRIGVQSIAILPLDYSHRVLGMLLLECAHGEQDWSEDDLRLLRLLGEIIASTLARRDAEAALKDARRVAEAASRAKSEFLASMSHELRTPLNGILGYAQLLARDVSLERRHLEAVHSVQHCGEHLLDLVNEVLDLARIESGRVELRPESTVLAELVNEVADLTRLRATQAGLAFSYETDAGLPSAVQVDPRRLKQILLNLLGNAVKFTPEGAASFRVRGLRLPSTRWRLRFEIQDTGIGIASDELPRIFEPFHRATGGRNVEGTGLGLAITRDLVEAMDGHLHVESVPGRGSLFVVELELAEADAHTRGGGARAQIIGYHGRRRVLLIADDKMENRTVLRRLLEPLGFGIHESADGRETLALAGRLQPDLLLLDIVMPDLDGFDVARRLKRHPQLAGIPIVAVSASVFDDTRQASLQAGCDDFLAKPVQLDLVLAVLEQHLGLRWIRAEDGVPAADAPLTPAALTQLMELSRRGDIAELNACLTALEAQGGYPKFVAELRGLARSFDMKAIRERLQRLGATLQ
jgi:PAS domain S-box-containing protein